MILKQIIIIHTKRVYKLLGAIHNILNIIVLCYGYGNIKIKMNLFIL